MTDFHPGLILILTGLVSLVLPNRKLRNGAAVLGAAVALAAMLCLGEDAALQWSFTPSITLELLRVDGLSRLFGLIFCVIAVIAGIYAMNREDRLEACMASIYAGSSLGVVFAGDWITLIGFWELMAVSSWYLVWAGGTHRAKRASYRYLVMHFLGGNLLLAGVVTLHAQGILAVGALTDVSGAAFWLVLLGVAVNGAIPPLHTWVPDAYPEATPSGTVYMGSYTTKVAIYALIRMFAGTEWLILVGAVMAVLAACMALIENDLRRLLSYHIVSQLGMMIAALGTGLPAGIDSAALHAAYNILYKGVLLMGAGAILTTTGKRKITEMGGLARKMPVTSVCFLIASLAIAGMPFLNGFASKALIMESLHQHVTAYWLVMLAGVGTWLSITLKINYFVFFGKTDRDVPCGRTPMHMQVAMVLGTLLCVITGIFPDYFYGLAPYATMGEPFTLHHILEYIGLFIGATIPFAMLLPKMAPHDLLTLDFDWFYRRWLPRALTWLSVRVHQAFVRCEAAAARCTERVIWLTRHPEGLFAASRQAEHETCAAPGDDAADRGADRDVGYEGEMQVGLFMYVFLFFCVAAFVIMILGR